MTANNVSEIFGSRITIKLKGKLNTTLTKQIEHGHHVFRAYWKKAFGWLASQRHHAAIPTAFSIAEDRHGPNQLRYDLRRIRRMGCWNATANVRLRLSEKETKVALVFALFHIQLCGPLANSLFHHQPDPAPSCPKNKLETAFHKADASIQKIIHLLEAA